MAGNSNFKTLYLLSGLAYFKFFSLLYILVVSSFRNLHRYPIMLKTKFGGNFVTSFSRQKCQNLKNKKHTILGNGEFYIDANFQVKLRQN